MRGWDKREDEVLHYHFKPYCLPFMSPNPRPTKKADTCLRNLTLTLPHSTQATHSHRLFLDEVGVFLRYEPNEVFFSVFFTALMSFTLCVTCPSHPGGGHQAPRLSAGSDRGLRLILPNHRPSLITSGSR